MSQHELHNHWSVGGYAPKSGATPVARVETRDGRRRGLGREDGEVVTRTMTTASLIISVKC
jgi:hypothetical protein